MGNLLTEADMRRHKRGECLNIPKGTIVTPAARDLALSHGICLVENHRPLPKSAEPCSCADPSSITITLPKSDLASYRVNITPTKVQVLEAEGPGRLLASQQRKA